MRKWGLYEIDKILAIEWGRLADNEPVSLSERQRENDRKRALPFQPPARRCVTCNVEITWRNFSRRYNHACLACEIAERRDE